MTKLTTHVLDVYSGKPGKGIKVDLYFIDQSEKKMDFDVVQQLVILILQKKE